LPGAEVCPQADVADGIGYPQHRGECAVCCELLDGLVEAGGRSLASWPRSDDRPAEVLGEPEAEVLREFFPALRDRAGLGVVGAQRAVVRGLADGHPLLPHVLEPTCAGRGAVEVGNQLPQNPCLVWVRDAAIPVLHDGLCEYAPPREVPQGCALELPTVHRYRRLR